MYIGNEKLKKASDKAYQEAEPPEDRSRPLEWRRAFHPLHMKLINVRLVRSFNVNEADLYNIFKAEDGEEHGPEVGGKVSRTVSIAADVDQENFRDKILFAVETERKSGIYQLERPNGTFTISVKPGEAHSSDDGRFKEVYTGHLGRNNVEPGDDGVWLELTAPKEIVDEIATVLATNPSATLDASVQLESFTYEVDDALREWYHPRDMFVESDHGRVFLSHIQVFTGNVQPRMPNPDDNSDEADIEQQQSWANTTQPASALNTKAIVTALDGVKVAIYIAAAAIIAAQFI